MTKEIFNSLYPFKGIALRAGAYYFHPITGNSYSAGEPVCPVCRQARFHLTKKIKNETIYSRFFHACRY